MASKGYVNKETRILADNVNAPHIFDEGGVTDTVSKHIVDIIDDHKEEIRPLVGGGGIYSTEERVVGTWINGETLYEKTYIVNIDPSPDNLISIPAGFPSNIRIKNYSGSAQFVEMPHDPELINNVFPLNGGATATLYFYLRIFNNKFNFYISSAYVGNYKVAHITIQYIKIDE